MGCLHDAYALCNEQALNIIAIIQRHIRPSMKPSNLFTYIFKDIDDNLVRQVFPRSKALQKEDIPLLVDHFMEHLNHLMGRKLDYLI